LRYNLDAANLVRHGLHARWLHAAVNVPLLFGPLAPVLYVRLARAGADLVQVRWDPC
jgi:phosphatidylinositol glycan class Z